MARQAANAKDGAAAPAVPIQPEWLNVYQVAAYVGLSHRTVRKYVENGDLPPGRVFGTRAAGARANAKGAGGRRLTVRWSRAELQRFLENEPLSPDFKGKGEDE